MTGMTNRVKLALHRLALFLLLPALPLAAAILPPFGSDSGEELFVVMGSNTLGAKLMPALAADYLRAKGLSNVERVESGRLNEFSVRGYLPQQPQGRAIWIRFVAHGSSTSFTGLEEGSAQLGMSSRPIKEQERRALRALGDMQSFAAEKVVAIDGLAVIVHPSNPLASLTKTQIAAIFGGEITDWEALGGSAGPINLYARDDNSGTWDTFKNLVLGKTYRLAGNARRFESNDALSALVSSDPGAIGFVGLAAVNSAKALAVAESGTTPLLPQQATVATEDYPLSRRLFLYVSPQRQNAILTEFIAFCQSHAGQTRVDQIGYISQTPIVVQPDLNAVEHQEYLATVKSAQRLSVNIRFNSGSAVLDNKAKQDILRLGQLLRVPENSDKQLLLIGFGDPKQTATRARILSKLRATAVKVALYDQGISTAPVVGFGAIMPIASEDKSRNQRVEIWLQN